MVKATLPCKEKTNSVLAFCDNSSAIKGNKLSVLYPFFGKNRDFKLKDRLFGEYVFHNVDYDMVFTAETQFSNRNIPISGAATGTGGRIRDNQSIGKGGLLFAGGAGYCVGNLHIDDYELQNC